jgi:hypothetical protein
MSTIPDVYHSLDWFLLGERLSNVVRPTKQNNKQPKNVFFSDSDMCYSQTEESSFIFTV